MLRVSNKGVRSLVVGDSESGVGADQTSLQRKGYDKMITPAISAGGKMTTVTPTGWQDDYSHTNRVAR